MPVVPVVVFVETQAVKAKVRGTSTAINFFTVQ
jgi:hypothetical protein